MLIFTKPYFFFKVLPLLVLVLPCLVLPIHEIAAQNEVSLNKTDNPVTIDSADYEELWTKAWKYYNAIQFDSFKILGKEAWLRGELALSHGFDSLTMAYTLFGKGLYAQGHFELGYFEEGLPLMEETLKERELLHGPILELSYIYVGLGGAYRFVGYKHRALSAHYRAFEIVEENVAEGDESYYLLGNKYLNLGHSYFEINSIDESLALYKKGLAFFRKYYPNDSKIGTFLLRISKIYDHIGDRKVAKEYLDSFKVELLKIEDSGYRRAREIEYYLSLGEYLEKDQSFSEAKKIYTLGLSKALQAVKAYPYHETPLTLYISGIYHSLANVNTKMGLLTQAEEAIEMAIDYWLKKNSMKSVEWKDIAMTKAEILAAKKDWITALDEVQAILQTYSFSVGPDWRDYSSFDQIPLNNKVVECLNLKAKILFSAYRNGEPSISSQDVLKACRIGQKYLEGMIKNYSSVEDITTFFQDNNEVYELPVELAYQSFQKSSNQFFIDSLFLISEKTKAFQLLSSLQGKRLQMKMGLPEEWIQQEMEAQKKLLLYEQQLAKQLLAEKRDSVLITYYQEQLKKYQGEIDNISKKIQKEYPAYHKLKYDVQPFSLRETQHYLKPDELLLHYYWGKDKIYVLAFNKRDRKAWSITLDESFKETLIEFTKSVRNPPQVFSPPSIQAFAEQGHYLFQKLLGPGLLQFPQTNLIIIPDGSLSYLPWAALTTSSSKEAANYRDLSYLLKNYQIRQEYSATLLQQTLPKFNHRYTYLGFAPNYESENWLGSRGMDTFQTKQLFPRLFRGDLPRLEKTKQEVEQAKNCFATGQMFLDEDATEQAFKSRYMDGRIQHFAMHGFTNDIDPLLSHLAFRKLSDTLEDGNLYAYEVYNMHIPADLAVLSACNTGDGAYFQGQGVMSLARAFKYAGVQDVLMSLWRADDEVAYLIMVDFFKNLKQKNNKGLALQQATLQYLNHHKNDHDLHPYYWSGFALIGPGVPLEKNSISWYWIVMIALLLLVISLSFYIRRNRVFS